MSTTNGTHGPTGQQADIDVDQLYAWMPPIASPQPLPEATFSMTLKGRLNGVEALLTARGMNAEEFKRNIESIKGLLDPLPTPASPQGQDGTTPQCPQHGAKRRSTRGTGWYCPRKNADGTYCKG